MRTVLWLAPVLVFADPASASDDGAEPISRCQYAPQQAQYSVPLRGTGYYWVEYIDRAEKSGGSGSLMLIESKRSLFPDRPGMQTERLECSEQLVVAKSEIEARGMRVVFDCHSIDEEANPMAELTVGLVKETRPGLHQPVAAWRVTVRPHGRGGEVQSVEASRVRCTVLPGIDTP